MKYNRGEFVIFSRRIDTPPQKGLIVGYAGYGIYNIQLMDSFSENFGHVYAIEEYQIHYSLNEHIVEWVKTGIRLPENDGLYLCSTESITIPGLYNSQTKIFTIDNVDYPANDIIAWMSLPDPYKRDEGGKW